MGDSELSSSTLMHDVEPDVDRHGTGTCNHLSSMQVAKSWDGICGEAEYDPDHGGDLDGLCATTGTSTTLSDELQR